MQAIGNNSLTLRTRVIERDKSVTIASLINSDRFDDVAWLLTNRRAVIHRCIECRFDVLLRCQDKSANLSLSSDNVVSFELSVLFSITRKTDIEAGIKWRCFVVAEPSYCSLPKLRMYSLPKLCHLAAHTELARPGVLLLIQTQNTGISSIMQFFVRTVLYEWGAENPSSSCRNK